MRAISVALAGLAAAGVASLAAAAEPPDTALKGLAACGGVSDVAAKAACYDAATAALTRAVKAGEVIIVQKKEAQAAQRNAFGFNLPSLSIFDRIGGDKGEAAKPLESVAGDVKRAYQDGMGKWVIELSDGAVWRQIDNAVLAPAP